ncbi:FAD-binding protein [Streptomyces niveiscabiei]|uniref:FAD-binding protein n=1 Tax=Streptomyces niveiscabiei TaxID=164115 RepID=UPI0029B04312|nr:FAD-binding protein [Streptomyces niveiscabiei]MDX3382346.1 FAD-binding protein [Streptomyces niveiscabiei]
MTPTPSRRTLLQGLAAGTAVVAFDPLTRSWAATADSAFAQVPPLDGTLLTDPASLAAAADDYGHIVHRTPAAVLRPGSVDDVVAMIRFCNTHTIDVAPRGQGHGTFGQAQVPDGVIIETTPLNHIGTPENGTVTVGAGALWIDVLRAMLRHGLTPPVFTDYIELSVGGTLSVGGIGGQTHRHGAQVDNVLALDVVTGAGELVHCSPARRADLFHAVLAGLGQCAVIVSATLRLVPAPTAATVRHYLLPYTDLDTFLADQRTLTRERRFDYVEGQVTADKNGAFTAYVLEAVSYDAEVPESTLLAGLSYDAAGVQRTTPTYFDFVNRVGPVAEELKKSGVWAYAHPWLNLLIPGDRTAEVTREILAGVTAADVGAGLILLYPLDRARLRTPLLPMPDDPVPYLFAILAATPPADTATVDRLLAANRAAYDTTAAAGGTQYPVGSIPFRPRDWRTHFGAAWPQLAAAKRTYDPKGVLVPGQGIFG